MQSKVIQIEPNYTLHVGDALHVLRGMPSASVDCIVTSPPYYQLRDYDVKGQLGLEETPNAYIAQLVNVFRESKRVLKDTGTFWVNISDTYSTNSGSMGDYDKGKIFGQDKFSKKANETLNFHQDKQTNLPKKTLIGIPAMLQVALIQDGWILRNKIIWHKPNALPSPINDRFTVDYEELFFFVKKPTGYYFDQQFEPYTEPLNRWAGNEPFKAKKYKSEKGSASSSIANIKNLRPNANGRNMRTTWTFPTRNYDGAHFAVFPMELPRRCLMAGCPPFGTALDMFSGSGTTLAVAKELDMKGIAIELNPKYTKLITERVRKTTPSVSVDKDMKLARYFL